MPSGLLVVAKRTSSFPAPGHLWRRRSSHSILRGAGYRVTSTSAGPSAATSFDVAMVRLAGVRSASMTGQFLGPRHFIYLLAQGFGEVQIVLMC